jgi:Enolase, C-terminal TIM barrel domain
VCINEHTLSTKSFILKQKSHVRLSHILPSFWTLLLKKIDTSERTAKYNQLLRIEEELGAAAKYPGIGFRSPEWMA